MNRPLAALVVILAAGVAVPVATPFAIVALVPLFLLARDGRGREAWAGAVAVTAATVVHDLAWDEVNAAALVATAALCVAVVAYGRNLAVRRTAAARERELLAEASAAEERLRIARELHDAVGHDVSLMVVQAQALGAVSEDPRVREGSDAIAALGRRTMGELHRTLKLLRDGGGTAPPPSLERDDDVLAGARRAGVDVSYAVEGTPRRLTPALDATAYRIVQEAITNVVRHAGSAPAAVIVRYRDDALELEVADEGTGAAQNGTGTGGGHGIAGMRERAEAFGGTLAAGPRAGRGFVVTARLPYAEPVA